MDAKVISPEYRAQQQERVEKRLLNLARRENALLKGEAIPDEEDLAIGTGKHMPLAVLFLDICNSTHRASNDADVQTKELKAMTLFFEEMIRIVEDLGGTVEKNTGDGLMAYFENEGYDDNGCTRAVSAALHMLRVNQDILPAAFAGLGLDTFTFRVGIDYGNVTVAHVGRVRGFHGIVAIGITTNIASKILDTAKADQIVIGDWVRDRLPETWKEHTLVAEPQTRFVQWRAGGTQSPYPYHLFTGRWPASAAA